LFTCSADGAILPLYILYEFKRMPTNITQKLIDVGISFNNTSNGWMTQEAFLYYLQHSFFPTLIQKKIQFSVILFLDNHTSHISLVSKFCDANQIILVIFFSIF
jgi:hypothetical protein